MRVVWCKKRTWLFVIACVVFLGGNIMLMNSMSWPWISFTSPSKPAESMGIKSFEKHLRDRLLEDITLVESEKNLDEHENKHVSKALDVNDVDFKPILTTSQPGDRTLRIIQGNRGDLEHQMFSQSDHDAYQTPDNVNKNKRLEENADTAQKEQVVESSLQTKSKEVNRKETIPVLVISCNRPAAVTRCLDQLLQLRPSAKTFPIIVSQDCGHEETAQTIQGYGEKILHIKQPDLTNIPLQPPMVRYLGYYKIARHFKWALTQVFDVMKYDAVIIVEDDLDIAPDFFEYFKATRPLLDKDSSIWCVSAWNDNGKVGHVQGQDILYRSDFFPGLGWMLTKKLWDELGSKWPKGFWDDWMREPDQRHDRVCIRPEISRTKTFGKIGVSMGQFYDKYLRFIHLNDQPYPFSKTDLSYLLKENYDKHYIEKVYKVPLVDFDLLQNEQLSLEVSRIEYSDKNEFVKIAHFLGIMDDFKAGVPRTAYMGVVSTIFKGKRLHIAPPFGTWSGYKS